MHFRSRAALVAAILAVLVAVPASAGAATKTVDMGTPVTLSKSLQKLGSDVNAFFPSATTIRVGDKVKFVPVGFHTVDLLKKGGHPMPLIAPAGKVSGENDAAGAPFWFNGQDQFGFNPALLKSGFGKTFTYSGAKAVSSGLPLSNKPKPMVVKFTKAGTFTYFCAVHPGMKATVKVVGASKSVPSPKADAARVAKQVAAAKTAAKSLPQFTSPANTVTVAPYGKGGVEYYGFAPGTLTVAPGTTVTFAMPAASTDEHTVTFGPGDAEQKSTYLGALADAFGGAPKFPGQATYPSEPKGTIATLNPSLHGNGFWNAGVLFGANQKVPGFASSAKVTFDTAGTYTYYCLIHPFMKGTVTVK